MEFLSQAILGSGAEVSQAFPVIPPVLLTPSPESHPPSCPGNAQWSKHLALWFPLAFYSLNPAGLTMEAGAEPDCDSPSQQVSRRPLELSTLPLGFPVGLLGSRLGFAPRKLWDESELYVNLINSKLL